MRRTRPGHRRTSKLETPQRAASASVSSQPGVHEQHLASPRPQQPRRREELRCGKGDSPGSTGQSLNLMTPGRLGARAARTVHFLGDGDMAPQSPIQMCCARSRPKPSQRKHRSSTPHCKLGRRTLYSSVKACLKPETRQRAGGGDDPLETSLPSAASTR